MSDHITTPSYRMRGLEDALNLDPLEEMHEAIAALEAEQGDLQAKRDNWDARRKQLRHSLTALIINELKAGNVAPPTSEAALERITCGDPRYSQMMDEAEVAFARLVVVNNAVQNLRDRIARGNALARRAA
jgi:uncharacterized small protein (DUF1192 family)